MKQKAIKKKKDISAPTPPPPKDKTDTPTNQSAYSWISEPTPQEEPSLPVAFPSYRKTYILLGIFFLLYCGFQFAIWWALRVIESMSARIFNIGVLYIFFRTLQKIFGKKDVFSKKDALDFFIRYARIGAIITTLLFTWIAYFVYYQLHLHPAHMSRSTFQSEQKTIVIQEMSHIASPTFYQQVQETIEKYKKDGYVLFYEWVTPGTPENMQTFVELLGVDITGNLYEQIAELFGLVVQENESFLWIGNDLDYNVDVSIDQIVEYYQTHCQDNPTFPECQPSSVVLSLDEINEAFTIQKQALSTLTPFWQSVVQNIGKAFLNTTVQDAMPTQTTDPHIAFLQSIILKYRNEIVAKEILESEHEKIFLLYGALHGPGIVKELKKYDHWTQTEQIHLYPYK